MGEERDAGVLAFAEELEQRDTVVATEIGELRSLEARVEAVRAQAAAADSFLTRLPGERARREAAVEDGRAELDEQRRGHDEAARELERLQGRRRAADQRAAAERVLVNATDSVRIAETRLARLEAAREELEREADALRSQVPVIEREAAEIVAALRGVARLSAVARDDPAPGLAALADWASRARAALFVARSGLESEREAIVRQANELASSVLGEPLSATSAALVRARIRRELEHRTAPGTRAESAP